MGQVELADQNIYGTGTLTAELIRCLIPSQEFLRFALNVKRTYQNIQDGDTFEVVDAPKEFVLFP